MKTSTGYWGYAAAPARVFSRRFRVIVMLTLFGAVAFVMGETYIFSTNPAESSLDQAASHVNQGAYDAAYAVLERFMNTDLTPEQNQRARQLFTRTLLAMADKKSQAGDVQGAQGILLRHLVSYRADKEFTVLSNRLDAQRLKLGEQLTQAGKHKEALLQYAAILPTSPFYSEAAGAVTRLWSSLEKPLPSSDAVDHETSLPDADELLQEARQQFKAGRLLFPMAKSAFALTIAALVMDPQSTEVRRDLSRIASTYRARGDRLVSLGNYFEAVDSYYRSLTINPGDRSVERKVKQALAQWRQQLPPTPWEEERMARLLLGSLGLTDETSKVLSYLYGPKASAERP